MKKFEVQGLYDEATATITYVVFDKESRDAVVIDPVLDYNPANKETSAESLDKLYSFIKAEKLMLHYCLETHAHADHLSGSRELKKRYPRIRIAIGERISDVQAVFKEALQLPEIFIPDGHQFDHLLKDGEKFQAGSIGIEIMFTPGHTPACASYLIGDAVFTGDTIFLPDTGTGRCDFPAGSSETLYHSIADKLYKLPDATRVFVGHDYKANDREARWETTIAQEKCKNIHLKAETAKIDFVSMRNARDATLPAPRLLLPSIKANINGGYVAGQEEMA